MEDNTSMDSLEKPEATAPIYELVGDDVEILIDEITDIPTLEKPEEPSVPKPNMENKPQTSSSVVTPYKPDRKTQNDIEDDDEDFEDETLAERLIGLTEMFPESIRNLTYSLGVGSYNFSKGFYDLSRSIVWIFATSAIILAAPVLIESERSQLEEMNRQQQRQILLGPSASGASSLTPTLTPPQPIK